MTNPQNIEEHKFQEGQSGNPGGRPLGAKNRSTILREIFDMQEKDKEGNTQTKEYLIHKAQTDKAQAGDTQAYNAIMDNVYGKQTQPINTTITDRKQVDREALVGCDIDDNQPKEQVNERPKETNSD